MENMIDIEAWIKTVVVKDIEYYAVYNEDGSVNTIFPSPDESSVPVPHIKIDSQIGKDISEGTRDIRNYRVDLKKRTLEEFTDLNEINGLSKIDDVLHRIIDKKWSNINNPDVSVKYVKNENILSFHINPLLKTQEWQGIQDMVFLITEYNDPNALIKMINFNVNELVAYPQIFTIELPEKFSIYTRRLFNNYTIEIV